MIFFSRSFFFIPARCCDLIKLNDYDVYRTKSGATVDINFFCSHSGTTENT